MSKKSEKTETEVVRRVKIQQNYTVIISLLIASLTEPVLINDFNGIAAYMLDWLQ